MSPNNLKSMTGFGRAERPTPLGTLSVELRTVNNRFQDASISLPPELGNMEPALRQLLKQEVARGKVDCRVRLAAGTGQLPTVRLNGELARAYREQLRQLEELGVASGVTTELLARLPGVLEVTPAQLDEEAAWEILRGVAAEALDALNRERAREGEALGRQLQELAQRLEELVAQADQSKGEVVERYRERLRTRLEELAAELKTQLDPGRLEMEVALYADRCDVEEELVRLRAHLERFEALLRNEAGEAVGKNFDFLTQEFHREINTLGSKARDTAMAGLVLEMKSVLERIREQIQNIQ